MIKFIKRLFTNLGIDLGTANTIVYVKNKGYMVNEPSVIATKEHSNVIALGKEAKEMLGKTHKGIKVIQPMASGVIADFIAGEEMIKGFIRLSQIPKFLINKIIIGVPSGITSVEKRAIIESAQAAGGRKVFLVNEPMAAAIGLGLDVMGADPCLIVDIGGGTTDIAVINYGGIVIDNTIRIAGNEMNETLIRFFNNTFQLRIGEKTAEMIKIKYGIAHTEIPEEMFPIKGIDSQTGMPRELLVSNHIFPKALGHIIKIITNAIMTTLDQLPPELAGDLIDRGIILTGGGALLRGLDDHVRSLIHIPVSRPDNALYCVAEGTRRILEFPVHYNSVLFV